MKKFFTRLKVFCPYLFLILIPVLNFYLLEWYTHNPFTTMKFYIQVMNILLFEFSALFLFAVTGRVSRALGIQTVCCALYGLANYFVYEFRGAPIQPWDILSVGTAASVADNYEYKLDRTAVIVLICFALLLLLEFFLRSGFRGPIPSLKKRRAKGSAPAPEAFSGKKIWIARLLLAAVTGLLCFGYTKMLHNETFVQTKLRLYDKLFTPTTIQFKNGTVTAFLMELQYISVEKPSGYDADEAAALLASYGPESAEETESTETKKPNIIVIMNEAFSDPAVLGEFSTNEDYMPFVHSLQAGAENTVSGYLNVSVKGGNTANTEFEYLTGNTMAFLPYGSIPYQQYIKEELPSMASWLSSLGYHTVAMHPYRAGGWDRDTVYPLLGFDEMHFEEFFKDSQKVRKYVSDLGDYEKIVRIYEEKEPGEPLFLFNVTMQNHSSYSDWNDYPNFSPDITVEGTDSKLLPAYLSLMKLSDQAIEALVNYFAAQEEETIIVFFGDHQPTDSVVNPVLKLHGKTASELTEQEEALRYKVPFFIWANFDIGEATDVETSANYLASRTLEAAGLSKPGYFSFLSGLSETVPVISANHALLPDGTFTTAEEQQTLLSDYQKLQYYLLFD
ncbi:MAG: LTA synthase family protein [Eubacteriales bacterium]|nr:LTA synthase family protein [Eubacteriales bacterium]